MTGIMHYQKARHILHHYSLLLGRDNIIYTYLMVVLDFKEIINNFFSQTMLSEMPVHYKLELKF